MGNDADLVAGKQVAQVARAFDEEVFAKAARRDFFDPQGLCGFASGFHAYHCDWTVVGRGLARTAAGACFAVVVVAGDAPAGNLSFLLDLFAHSICQPIAITDRYDGPGVNDCFFRAPRLSLAYHCDISY